MFVSQKRAAARKPFQKPNILRRKPKATKRNTEKNKESLALSTINSDFELAPLPVVQTKALYSEPLQISQSPSFRVISISGVCDDRKGASQTLNINGDSLTIYAHDAQVDASDLCTAQSTFNVESFLNDGSMKKGKMLFNIDDTSQMIETSSDQKWCLDLGNENSKNIVTTSYYDGSQISNIYIDTTSIVCTNAENAPSIETFSETNKILANVEKPAQIKIEAHNTTVKFMCDVPNCKKSFWTEARLQMHKNLHNKPKTFPVLHCPVKNTDADGVETQCDRTFNVRNQLMKHLDDDHSPDDALYKCTKCGRRFYWASGARLHQANECARTFACAWAGCGRVFRQQCRLREHERAHTGDRPYPCQYPGCDWSFRSASKLMRHARRHTGERRHACDACGRAFPRREHLREHTARYHDAAPAPAPAPATLPLPCTHSGCERSFSTTSSLYAHVKKTHKDEDTSRSPKKQKRVKKEEFVPLLSPPPEIVPIEAIPEAIQAEGSERTLEESAQGASAQYAGAAGVVGEAEGRCARTHCTWPLRPRDAHYGLEDHAQVEQSESCESNIYTVRSDLFLHGNLLINEDNEFIISRAAGGESAGAEGAEGGAGEGELGLLDSHPTGDLTQEELMYADAVDESSFRVFLLNGEELA